MTRTIAPIDLRLHKAAFNEFELLAELPVDAFYSLAFLLQTRGSSQHCKLFLFDLKNKLVTDRAQLVLEVYIVGRGLLRLVSKKSQLLGQQGDLLLL